MNDFIQDLFLILGFCVGFFLHCFLICSVGTRFARFLYDRFSGIR